jgi:hypothetical protein
MIDLLQGIAVIALTIACFGNAYWNARNGRDIEQLRERVYRLTFPLE